MKSIKFILFVQKIKLLFIERVSGFLASLFSVVFSLSVIKEVYRWEENVGVLGLFIFFITSFLIFNEYLKVTELRKKWREGRSNYFIIVLTFVISFFMSGVGIYLWTDKTHQRTTETLEKTSISELALTRKYNNLIDSVSSLEFSFTSDYKDLSSQIEYWKGKRAGTLEERTQIRNRVDRLQNRLNVTRERFEANKHKKVLRLRQLKSEEMNLLTSSNLITDKDNERNNFITIIFLCMVVMTEILIVYIARLRVEGEGSKLKRISKLYFQYKERYAILTDILLRKKEIVTGDVKACQFIEYTGVKEEKKFDYISDIYSLFVQLRVTKRVNVSKAQEILNNYYKQIIKL